MNLVRCDDCGVVVDKPGKLGRDWSCRVVYLDEPLPTGEARYMAHRCPACTKRAGAAVPLPGQRHHREPRARRATPDSQRGLFGE